MNSLEPFREGISSLCRVHKVKRLYVFDSVLTNASNSQSNIDLLVSFSDMNTEEYADNYFDFKFSLQDILKRHIDLLEEQSLKNSYLLKSIGDQKQLFCG